MPKHIYICNQVKETERAVWLELDETRNRLEAMGEFTAMMFKEQHQLRSDLIMKQQHQQQQQQQQQQWIHEDDSSRQSSLSSSMGSIIKKSKLKIAIIAPATTKGINTQGIYDDDDGGGGGGGSFDVKVLPLCTALLTSLYQTCEEDLFVYTVFLAVNEDDVLADPKIVSAVLLYLSIYIDCLYLYIYFYYVSCVLTVCSIVSYFTHTDRLVISFY
jgi:hypothetical protein